MLYTEYRPQKFNELVNSDYIVSTLTGGLAKANPPHAYFFTGSRGIGKTTTARLLAKALNCEKPVTKEELIKNGSPDYIQMEPCGKCKSCVAVAEGNHLDLIEIDAASNRGIDNIRDLRDKVSLSPTMSKNKVYIIDEVHMLTTEASNALLKTLEEPPAHAFFILCTTNPEKVLDTIKSRCIKIQFNRPSIEDISAKLRKIANDKKFEISDEKLKRIAVLSKGAFRESETLLEQLMNGESYVAKILNEQESDYFEFTSLLLDDNKKEAIQFIHIVYQEGISLESWTEKYIEYLRSLMLQKLNITGIDNTIELNELEKSLVDNTSIEIIKLYIELFTNAVSEFKYTVIPSLPLEMAIVSIPANDNAKGLSNQKNDNPSQKTEKEGNIKFDPESNLAKEPNHKQDTNDNDKVASKSKAIDTATDTAKPTVTDTSTSSAKATETASLSDTVLSTDTETGTSKTVQSKETSKKHEENKKADNPKPQVKLKFPYADLIETIKPQNHSIHVMLRACQVDSFDGEKLNVLAFYSFHKERLMSRKIRDIIEDTAQKVVGNKVVFNCILSDKKPNATRLTDKNIVPTNAKDDVVEVFEKVFEDELE